MRALGRLPDAVEPFGTAVELRIDQQEWKWAAVNSGNLSELLVTLGRLEPGEAGALHAAQAAVRYADQSADPEERHDTRRKLAMAWHSAGDIQRAEQAFREAAELGQSHLFYALEILLDQQRYKEVTRDSFPNTPPLVAALTRLNAARARIHLDQGQWTQDKGRFDEALTHLHRANSEDDTIRGYLARAEANLHFGLPDPQLFSEDLADAETIAKRGPMPLFACDAALLRSRWRVVSGEWRVAGEYRDKAADLIQKHHYGRRVPELAVLDAELNPTLETFRAACERVQAGWWHLIPRLEALVPRLPRERAGLFSRAKPNQQATQLLQALLEAERQYHAARDAYLKKQAKA